METHLLYRFYVIFCNLQRKYLINQQLTGQSIYSIYTLFSKVLYFIKNKTKNTMKIDNEWFSNIYKNNILLYLFFINIFTIH